MKYCWKRKLFSKKCIKLKDNFFKLTTLSIKKSLFLVIIPTCTILVNPLVGYRKRKLIQQTHILSQPTSSKCSLSLKFTSIFTPCVIGLIWVEKRSTTFYWYHQHLLMLLTIIQKFIPQSVKFWAVSNPTLDVLIVRCSENCLS